MLDLHTICPLNIHHVYWETYHATCHNSDRLKFLRKRKTKPKKKLGDVHFNIANDSDIKLTLHI